MNGVLYVATNTNRWHAPACKESKGIDVAYSIYAARSAASVKKLLPNVHITLYADTINKEVLEREGLDGIFDEILFHQYPKFDSEGSYQFESKLYAFLNSPYEKTIFLDADTVVLSARIIEAYIALDYCDIAGVPYGNNNVWGESFKAFAIRGNFEKEAMVDKIPAYFIECTSSMLAFNKSDINQKMFQLAYDIYMKDPYGWRELLKRSPINKEYWSDMYTLWYAQWTSHVRRTILPQAFSHHGSSDKYKDDAEIIVHHSRQDYENLTLKGRSRNWKTQFDD